MQVSVEKTSELNRKMTVHLPEELVQEKMQERLKTAAREVNLKGFRPGKVPQKVIKKMYGEQIRGEVLGDLIQSSYMDALREQDQKPAGPPNIQPAENEEVGEGFEYIAEFEVYPDISLDGLDQITVVTKNAEIADSDLQKMIDKLREQRQEWQEVERVSQTADKVTIHFTGTCEEKNFTDGKVEDYPVVLGEKQMIPGFEDNLIDLKAGDSKTFEASFPEEYGNKDLAGKAAVFDVEVIKVEEGVLPEITAEFMKDYGVDDGDMEAFKSEIKQNMQRELMRAIRANTKSEVLEQVYQNVSVSLPKIMIDQEIEALMKPIKENAEKQNKDLDLPGTAFEDQAKRRVSLSLIMGEILQSGNITVDGDKVRVMIEELAESYEQPQELINYYYGDEQRLQEVQQLVLEEQVVDWVLEKVNVAEEQVAFEELMNQKR